MRNETRPSYQLILSASILLLTAVPIVGLRAATTPTPGAITGGNADKALEFLEMAKDYQEKGMTKKAAEYRKIAAELDPTLSDQQDPDVPSTPVPSPTVNPPAKGLKQTRVDGFLENARGAYEARDYPGALKFLALVETLDPGNKEASDLRSRVQWVEFKADPSRPYDRLVRDYFEQAVDRYRDRDYERALQALRAAEELDPGNPSVAGLTAKVKAEYSGSYAMKETARAGEQWKQGNAEAALGILEGVLKDAPGYGPALDLKGSIQNGARTAMDRKVVAALKKAGEAERKDRYSDAILYYRKALDQDPSNPDALSGLDRMESLADPLKRGKKALRAALNAGRAAEAAGLYSGIAELSPKDPELPAFKKKLDALSGEKSSNDALSKADVAYNLGLESYRKGDLSGAKKFWTEALRSDPGSIQAKRNLDRLAKEHPEL